MRLNQGHVAMTGRACPAYRTQLLVSQDVDKQRWGRQLRIRQGLHHCLRVPILQSMPHESHSKSGKMAIQATWKTRYLSIEEARIMLLTAGLSEVPAMNATTGLEAISLCTR